MKKKRYLTAFLLTLFTAVAHADETTVLSKDTEETLISHVRIRGNHSIPDDALRHNLKRNGIVADQPIDPVALERMRQQVEDHYRYFNRYHADVELLVTPLNDSQAEIELRIHEYTIKPAGVTGNNNDPYADSLYTEPDNYGDYSSPHDEAQEISDGNLSLGIGYGDKGALFKGNLIKRRLFGTNMSMQLSGYHDRYESNIDLGLSKPNVIRDGWRLDTNIFYDAFDNHRSRTIAHYDRRSYGLQSKMTMPMDRYSAMSVGLRYTHNRLKDIRPEYHRALYLDSMKEQQWRLKSNNLDLLLGWDHKQLNRKFLPSKGIVISLNGNISLPGSDNRYYKVKLDASGYYPLNKSHTWVLGAKTSLGYARGIDGHEVPFYQLFTAGGLNTLRGFSYGTVGPRAVYAPQAMSSVSTNPQAYTKQDHQHTVGGNALVAGSIELAVPNIYLPEAYRSSVRTAFFVDAASVWTTDDGLIHPLAQHNGHSRRVRVSGGLSLQWKFPSGVLSVSYAIPIKKYAGDRREQLQLTIGSSF